MICSLIDSFSIGINMQQVKLEIAAFFFFFACTCSPTENKLEGKIVTN